MMLGNRQWVRIFSNLAIASGDGAEMTLRWKKQEHWVLTEDESPLQYTISSQASRTSG